MQMTPAEDNREKPLHRRVRPQKDWHRLLCRYGSVPELPDGDSDRFNHAIDLLIHRFQDSGIPFDTPASVSTHNPWSSATHILDQLPDAILVIDSKGTVQYSNRVARELIQRLGGFEWTGPSHWNWTTLLKFLGNRKELIRWARDPEQCFQQPCAVSTPDGKSWELRCHAASTPEPHYQLILRDISRLEESRYKAQYNSHHDALTGLPNRVGLLAELRHKVEHYHPDAPSHALFFFDLDGFKFVNDSLGHQAGDQLLCAVARRIQASLQVGQRLYRLGGDEFVVQVEGIQNLHRLSELAETLGKAFLQPFPINGKDTHLGASIGIAVLNGRTKTADQWIQQADLAMYEAKQAGGHGHAFYNEDIEQEIQKRYQLRADIRQALKQQEFQVFYQPKYCLKTRKLSGAEALIRWVRDGKFYSSPSQFIPEAETCGLIIPISQAVFNQVATDVDRWMQTGLPGIVTSVNISACHFQLGDLVDDLLNSFPGQGIPSSRIELEITESSFLQDPTRAAEKIRTLQRLGFSISIDDFGTGYSSLNYLKQLPADLIKIDRSYVAEILESSFDATLVQSVIHIAHAQNMKVVAEGVESLDVVNQLKEFGCDYVQGYWYGKPMPAEEFEKLYLQTGESAVPH